MNKPKKIPLRKCVATLEIHPKQEMLRIVKTPENTIIIDLKGKANGRGAYISKSMKALDIAIKKKSLERCLEMKISDEIYEEMRKIIKNIEQ